LAGCAASTQLTSPGFNSAAGFGFSPGLQGGSDNDGAVVAAGFTFVAVVGGGGAVVVAVRGA